MPRFYVVDKSDSGHCCFSHSVLDSENGESSANNICECFNETSANLIASLLNQWAPPGAIEDPPTASAPYINPCSPEQLNTLSKLEAAEFEGPDADLRISLEEYDFAWKDLGDEVLIIYRANTPENPPPRFGLAQVSRSLNLYKEYRWAHLDSVHEVVGMSAEDWDALPIERRMLDMYRYYGVANIFGENSPSFEVNLNE